MKRGMNLCAEYKYTAGGRSSEADTAGCLPGSLTPPVLANSQGCAFVHSGYMPS